MKNLLLYKLLFILFACLGLSAQAQHQRGRFNQYDDQHRKDGLWKVYLNDHLTSVKDSAEAYYYAYNYYENGELVTYTGGARAYKKKALRIESDQPQPVKGKPVLLNGHFKFYFKKGLGEEDTYKDGLPVFQAVCDSGVNKDLVQTEVLDFTQQYHGMFGSFRYTRRNYANEVFEDSWFGKNENGKWDFIKINR